MPQPKNPTSPTHLQCGLRHFVGKASLLNLGAIDAQTIVVQQFLVQIRVQRRGADARLQRPERGANGEHGTSLPASSSSSTTLPHLIAHDRPGLQVLVVDHLCDGRKIELGQVRDQRALEAGFDAKKLLHQVCNRALR